MADRLKDRIAVVTGAGRGIGRGVAIALAVEGAKVVVNDLGGAVDGSGGEQTPADAVVAEIKAAGGEAVANYDSVATAEGGNSIVQTAVDTYGRIDILVNNAGILRDRMVFNMTSQEWDDVIKVHLYGVFNTTKPAATVMRQQRSGRIVNMSSTSGLIGNSGQANYGAAKAGIAGFTRVVARDLGRYGVTCNAIAPGASTRMTMSDEVIAARDIRASKGVSGGGGQTPSQAAPVLRDPDDVAPIVVYLCTDAAANINGQTFGASGGTIQLYQNPIPIKSIHKNGRWTLDELLETIPGTLTAGLANPAPPQPPKE